MSLQEQPVTEVGMLIRKPITETFNAFIDPDITTKFWFTKSSGHLETGRNITWTWEMFDVSVDITVKAIEANKRILIQWGNYENPTLVEWLFTECAEGTTYVIVINSGFTGDEDSIVQQALDSKGGFAFMLAGLKALLEHNIMLNLSADHVPPATNC